MIQFIIKSSLPRGTDDKGQCEKLKGKIKGTLKSHSGSDRIGLL